MRHSRLDQKRGGSGINKKFEFDLIIRKVTTFRRLANVDRKLAFAALGLLAVVRTALWLLAFQRVAGFLQISDRWRPVHRDCTPRQIAWAVRLASRYVPDATCLPQALATHLLLSRHGHPSCLRIGVASGPKFEAHAWVECDGSIVIGEVGGLDRFASILTLNTLQSRRVPDNVLE